MIDLSALGCVSSLAVGQSHLLLFHCILPKLSPWQWIPLRLQSLCRSPSIFFISEFWPHSLDLCLSLKTSKLKSVLCPHDRISILLVAHSKFKVINHNLSEKLPQHVTYVCRGLCLLSIICHHYQRPLRLISHSVSRPLLIRLSFHHNSAISEGIASSGLRSFFNLPSLILSHTSPWPQLEAYQNQKCSTVLALNSSYRSLIPSSQSI